MNKSHHMEANNTYICWWNIFAGKLTAILNKNLLLLEEEKTRNWLEESNPQNQTMFHSNTYHAEVIFAEKFECISMMRTLLWRAIIKSQYYASHVENSATVIYTP